MRKKNDMSFDQTLRQLVQNTEGAMACILMGQDGLPIGSFQLDDYSSFDANNFGIEFSGILNQLVQMARQTHFDIPIDLILRSREHVAIFHLITEDYFVLLLLSAEGNVGKGAYLLRTLAPSLKQELFS